MTSSHSRPLILRSQIRPRTRPLKTSAPPPGQRAETSFPQRHEHLGDRETAELREVRDLARREGLDMDIWSERLERPHHAHEVLQRQLRVLAADDMDLADAAHCQSLPRLLDDLLDGQRIGVGVALVVTEGAEQAAVAAHVGVVDVTVADEEDVVADSARPREVGHGSDGEKIVALEQRARLRCVQALSGLHTRPDGVETSACGESRDIGWHHEIDSRPAS